MFSAYSFIFVSFIFEIYYRPCSSVVDLSAMDVTRDGHIVIMDRYGSFLTVSENGEVIHYFDCKQYVKEPSDIAVNGKATILYFGTFFYTLDFHEFSPKILFLIH